MSQGWRPGANWGAAAGGHAVPASTRGLPISTSRRSSDAVPGASACRARTPVAIWGQSLTASGDTPGTLPRGAGRGHPRLPGMSSDTCPSFQAVSLTIRYFEFFAAPRLSTAPTRLEASLRIQRCQAQGVIGPTPCWGHGNQSPRAFLIGISTPLKFVPAYFFGACFLAPSTRSSVRCHEFAQDCPSRIFARALWP